MTIQVQCINMTCTTCNGQVGFAGGGGFVEINFIITAHSNINMYVNTVTVVDKLR